MLERVSTISNDAPRKTVDKAMRVLHSFTPERPELSIGELSESLGLHKSVVSRLVAALREWRMLEKDPTTQRIRIGSGAFRIGTLFAHRDALVRCAMSPMSELVAATGHSAHLSVLDGTAFLVVATVESPNALRVIMRVGDQRPLHTTAAGKLFLALSHETLLEEVCRGPGLNAATANTCHNRAKLERQLRTVRREGIAWNAGENTLGAGAVAAPVLDAHGAMLAALSTVYPLHLVDRSQRSSIAELTVHAARKVSNSLSSPH